MFFFAIIVPEYNKALSPLHHSDYIVYCTILVQLTNVMEKEQP